MKPLAAIILAILLGALAAWAILAAWLEQRRRQRLIAGSGSMSLRFSAGDPFDLPDLYFHLHLFGLGHSRTAGNVLHGMADGRPVRLFEYQFETGARTARRTHRWQVALVHTEFRFSGLLVQPADRRDPLEVIFGFQEFPFQAEPFARKFHVAGEDRQFAYQFLHGQMADLLLSEPGVSLEARDQLIALYRPGPLPPDQAIALLRLACRIPAVLPPQLAQELREEMMGRG